MKTKAVAAIMITMFLVGMTFYAFPVKAQVKLKIGVIGPYGWVQWDGMIEGAQLAANWINGPGGGIVIDGTRYDVELVPADSHAADYDPPAGRQEMIRLCTTEDVDYVIGGFRTENVMAFRDVPMTYDKLYFIAGAATNELVDCGAAGCGSCVRCDYDNWKYTFRITPINVTMLIYNIMGFIRYYILPYRLCPLYGAGGVGPVNTAVISEDLDWSVGLHNAFVYAGYLGPQANIVYHARTPAVPPAGPTTDFTPYLDAMHAAEVRLVVHIYSAPNSAYLAAQLKTHPLKATMMGIDVNGQSTEFWDDTGGGCEYEAFLCTTGTRTPLVETSQPYSTTEVWDLYYAAYEHAPIYTMWGVYDGIISMHDTLEAQTGPTYIEPPFDTADSDALVPIIEATDRQGVVGKFKYTTFHDPYSIEFLSTWEHGYVRALWGQWQAGRIEVCWPADPDPGTPGTEWARIFSLPDESNKMYPYPNDVNQDGSVGFVDAMFVRNAFGGEPLPPDVAGDPRWYFVADTVVNLAGYPDNTEIDVYDALYVRGNYGDDIYASLPLTYCNEGGHLQ